MTDALATIADDYREPGDFRSEYRGKRNRAWNGVATNLANAKVAREKKPPAKAAQTEVAPIVQPPAPASPPPPLVVRPIESYDDLVAAFRAAKQMRGMSNHHCDELCNLAAGHTDAILGPTGRKNFGPLSFNAFLWAFSVKLVMVVDVEREAEMAVHWADRQRELTHVRETPSRVSKILIERATPYVMSALAKKGWETRRSKARKS